MALDKLCFKYNYHVFKIPNELKNLFQSLYSEIVISFIKEGLFECELRTSLNKKFRHCEGGYQVCDNNSRYLTTKGALLGDLTPDPGPVL